MAAETDQESSKLEVSCAYGPNCVQSLLKVFSLACHKMLARDHKKEDKATKTAGNKKDARKYMYE